MNAAVILGVGPIEGLGAQLCLRFARRGMHVYVAGRSRGKLEEVVSRIEADGGRATACVTDASSESAIAELFQALPATERLSLAIYNVGNNFPGRILDMETSYFEEAWRSVCLGGFVFASQAYRHMQPAGEGVILFTGASASLRGKPNFAAFNSSKAALRTFAQALAKEAGPEGIHVGHVIVDGSIAGDKVRERYPDYAEKLRTDGMISLTGIVDAFEFIYEQEKTAWTFELDLRTAIENW